MGYRSLSDLEWIIVFQLCKVSDGFVIGLYYLFHLFVALVHGKSFNNQVCDADSRSSN